MSSTNAKRFAVAAFLVAATSGGVAVAAATHSSPASPHWTPNDCINLNHGDYTACNVGNGGAGNLPYRP